MPNPKRRHSKSRTRMRRAHDALQVPNVGVDPVTGDPVMPHRANPKTGTYKGRVVVKQKAEKE
jgi:large subunit ribosomal protein L32